MSPESHARVRKLFDEALELPEGARAVFVASACAGDEEVSREVLRLLDGHARSKAFLENEAAKRIGRYLIGGELGRGAMGIVYEAVDPALGRNIALKLIHLQGLNDPKEAKILRERLFTEARLAGGLRHPGIVTVFDVGQEGEVPFIAMELVEGPSLQGALTSGLKPRHEDAIEILRQTAAALDYAHQNEIVHRDVKPANIMLHKGVTVKVGDFGIAKAVSTRHLTHSGMMLGTPSYMSPEQIEGRPVGGSSDQFSLAVVAYELLTGARPFQAESLAGLAHAIVYGERPSARAVSGALPAAVDRVLHRALAKAPEERFANCTEFADALDNALKGISPLGGTALLRIPMRHVLGAAAVLALAAGLLYELPTRLSNRADLATERVQAPEPQPPLLAVPFDLTTVDCAATHDPRISNNWGTVRVLSGTGTFGAISRSNRSVDVAPQSQLKGTITLRVLNRLAGQATMPLIGTPSWGNPSSSFWTIVASVMPGEYTLTTEVPFAAPGRPGTYHVLFAFAPGLNGSDVASATDWVLQHDVWGDGNDIATLDAAQIAQAEKHGCAVDQWRALAQAKDNKGTEYLVVSVPVDAVTLQVE